MFKRVKTSEEEEHKLPISNDGFSIGESYLNSRAIEQSVRKSNRKRVKSKVLREADGEVFESFKTEKEIKYNSKGHLDIQRMKKLDENAAKNDEIIPIKEDHKYLVQYKYNYESVHKDVVCYCQSFSGGDMVA